MFNSSGVQTGTIGSGLGFVRGIWVDSDGSIWTDVDATGNVYHFSAAGVQLSKFNVGAANGAFGIAGDAGYLYIALSSTNTVAQYTRSGTLVSTFGGYGTTLGKMRTPQGLSFRSGRQAVRRRGEHRPRQRVDRPVSRARPRPGSRAGIILGVAMVSPGLIAALPANAAAAPKPSVTAAYAATIGGPGHAAMYPSGMEIAPNGNIVIADTGNDQVAEYTPAGTQVWRVGS